MLNGIIHEYLNLVKLQVKFSSCIPPGTNSFSLIRKFRIINKNIDCLHNETHILSFIVDLLRLQNSVEGCIIEAGSYRGGSTAKISLITKLINRQMVVFDSFKGLPPNKEDHDQSIMGHSIKGLFHEGNFCGSVNEVLENITKYGEPGVCKMIVGRFEDTMPDFSEKVIAAYLDVDLASSTRTCLKYIYPLLVPEGILFSQDGDIPLVREVFNNSFFWENEVGCKKPEIQYFCRGKIIKIVKNEISSDK